MKKDPNKLGPSQRQLRVGEQIRHIMAETLARGHFHDEQLIEKASIVTVTEVRPTPDLKQATAYVIALGGGAMEDILPALNNDAAIFQKDINTKSNLKFTPRVRFKHDVSFDKAQKLENILNNIEYSDQE